MEYSEGRDESGRYFVSVNNYWWFAFPLISWRIAKKFSLERDGQEIKDMFQEFRSRRYKHKTDETSFSFLLIDVDLWGGLIVTAEDEASEEKVKEIGEYLKRRFT